MKKILAAGLIAFSTFASAQTTVTFNGWAYGGSGTPAAYSFLNDPRSGTASSGSGLGGGFNITLNSSTSFIAYCTELFQTFSFGSTYSDYSRLTNAVDYKWSNSSPGINGWDPSRAVAVNDRIGQLWAYAGATYGLTGSPGTSSSANQSNSTALQWAIWNVVYDTDNSVSAGNFSIAGNSGNQSVLNTANSMLANSLSYGFKYDLDVLKASHRQDQLITNGTVSPIPEPGSFAMMLAGLGCVGFVARRRRLI